ncbi:hypothetical protein G3489_19510 [Shewanella baltica]|uniref:hypothetical protein n=1 Tax=Shewanella baltica TaxID=62322 RepID=UPI00217EBABD|nr:hypothetical protein [Shewanella baltica]MCS6271865.1 hypothetical protein [Shewanella baltica]
MSRLLIPKLDELVEIPTFLKKVYIQSQNNEFIDPLWKGVAVMLNNGADTLINNSSDSIWYGNNAHSLFEKKLGYNGRIGIVTQYEDRQSVDFMNKLYRMKQVPWVRISCFVESIDNKICGISSISIDARFCTSLPFDFFDIARKKAQPL